MPYLVGIAIKREKRASVEKLASAEISLEAGVAGDYRGASGGMRFRQVTVLSTFQWQEACQEVDANVLWVARRANLLVHGHSFGLSDVGKRLHIGETSILEIIGETAPCSRMDEVCIGLKDALKPNWRGGVTCRVIAGGTVWIGDTVYLK